MRARLPFSQAVRYRRHSMCRRRKCLRLVRQLFAHFDADSDGHLSKPELRAFALATEGTEYDDDTLEELLRSFHSGSRGLTLSGFLALYRETELMDLARDARSLGLG